MRGSFGIDIVSFGGRFYFCIALSTVTQLWFGKAQALPTPTPTQVLWRVPAWPLVSFTDLQLIRTISNIDKFLFSGSLYTSTDAFHARWLGGISVRFMSNLLDFLTYICYCADQDQKSQLQQRLLKPEMLSNMSPRLLPEPQL